MPATPLDTMPRHYSQTIIYPTWPKFLDKLLVCDGATVIVQTYVDNLAFS